MKRRVLPYPSILWVAFLTTSFGLRILGQPTQLDPASQFKFTPQALKDGSETFDTLIRTDNGLLVYACVRKPPGAGPFPGMILIHGGLGGSLAGTRGCAVNSAPANALVSHGYAVLSTDYRAGDWVTEYRDVIAAYDFFKQQPFVKDDAIGIMGGSHGGKLSFDVITHVRLQAAVPCSGLYDLAKLYEHCLTSEYHQFRMSGGGGGAKAFLTEIAAQLGGTPGEVPEKYREVSGIGRVNYVETPVLLVHGEQDASVPISMTRELVAELQRQGKTVETFFAKKGPHGFYWGASAQGGFGVAYDPSENEAFMERLLAFLDKYLKTGK